MMSIWAKGGVEKLKVESQTKQKEIEALAKQKEMELNAQIDKENAERDAQIE